MKSITMPIILLLSSIVMVGCSPANISSNLREPSTVHLSMQTRCVNFDTGRDGKGNSLLSKYDGWKVVYVSEYTTPNKTTTAMIMCFEKPR